MTTNSTGAEEAKDKAVSAVKGIYGQFGLSGEGIFADETIEAQ